jgi:hypothetical protein
VVTTCGLKRCRGSCDAPPFASKGILSAATYEDRPTLEVTPKQLSEVQSELLMQVLKSKVRLNHLFSSDVIVQLPTMNSVEWSLSVEIRQRKAQRTGARNGIKR